jgi:NADH dehydrogenase
VVGDASAIPPGEETSELAPQLAPAAIQSGRHAAKQLVAAHRGLNASSFAYKDRGMMATIGRRAAIAEIRGPAPLERFSLKGTLGWLAWLFLHLANLRPRCCAGELDMEIRRMACWSASDR